MAGVSLIKELSVTGFLPRLSVVLYVITSCLPDLFCFCDFGVEFGACCNVDHNFHILKRLIASLLGSFCTNLFQSGILCPVVPVVV